MSPASSRFRAVVIVGGLTAALFAASPSAPADAHPFGPPQTAAITVTSADTVQIRWKFGGDDDISYLAVALEVLPADRVTLDGAVIFTDGDDTLVAGSAEFGAYVEQHIRVSSAGRSCSGTVRKPDALIEEGVTATFRCPGGLDDAEVTIDMLNDLHPAYRTLVTGPGDQRAVYDGSNTVHRWSLAGAAPPESATAESPAAESPAAESPAAQSATAESPAAESAAAESPAAQSAGQTGETPAAASAAGTDLGAGTALQLGLVGAAGLVLVLGIVGWRRRKRRA